MQKFKITIAPIPAKRLELMQTLESLLERNRSDCEDIQLRESKKLIIVTGTVKDIGQLIKMAESKEFEVLNGALSILAVKTDLNITIGKGITQTDPLKLLYQ